MKKDLYKIFRLKHQIRGGSKKEQKFIFGQSSQTRGGVRGVFGDPTLLTGFFKKYFEEDFY